MNKKLFKSLFALIFLLLLMTACGDLKMEIKKNGSGSVQVEVPGGGFVSKSDVEEQLNEMYGNQDGISKIKVRERKNRITAEFKFDSIDRLGAGAFSKDMSEILREDPNISESLNFVKKPVKFNEKSKEVYLQLPTDLNDFDTVEVTLPGRVIAHSENLKTTKSNIVEYESGATSYIVYAAGGGGFLKNVFTFFLVLVLAGGIFLFLQSNKKKAKEETQTEQIN